MRRVVCRGAGPAAYLTARRGGSESLEGLGQVGRVGALVSDVLAGAGVVEAQPHGVQPLPFEAEAGGQGRIGAVGEVAGTRVVQRREVDADLVSAPGLEVDVEQRSGPERL